MNDFFMRIVQFEPDVEGLVVPLPDGDYRIYVNSIFSAEKQREIFNHEMRHILCNHYSKLEQPLTLLEEQANDTTLLNKEIEQAALCGISSPLLPVREINPWELEPMALFPGYKPTYSDMDELEILETVLFNLENLQKEVDKLLAERGKTV